MYSTVRDNESLDTIAEKFALSWKDLAIINDFMDHNGVLKPPTRFQRLKLGTEINLPNRKLNIARAMEVIKNMTAEELSGKLSKSNDQDNPYDVSEADARTWTLPEDFWGVLKGPL